MRLIEAALTVMQETGKPMHARDIYTAIKEKGIFEFNAKDPVSVVSQTLRKRAGKDGSPAIEKTGPNTYQVI